MHCNDHESSYLRRINKVLQEATWGLELEVFALHFESFVLLEMELFALAFESIVLEAEVFVVDLEVIALDVVLLLEHWRLLCLEQGGGGCWEG